MDVAMSLSPAAKMAGPGRMEKFILREAFAQDLPASIAWRQKEQFSDGVGYEWIDTLKSHAAADVSDRAMANAHLRFPYNTPATKEAYFYRTIFHEHFSHDACARTVPGGASVACSTAEAIAWDASFAGMADPSGRAVRGVHSRSY
jgi:asparagine synthase (glutamine-hydrolysing)